MRISRRADAPEAADQLNQDIAAAAHGLRIEGRICGESCAMTCPRCGSTRCQCTCAAHCPQAPYALSSDPARHPIEPAITPLVFEMKRLGVLEPCYSCEGHAGPDGALYKSPCVWFYCEAPVYLRLLAGGLAKLHHAGTLSAPWTVSVTFSDEDNPHPTFALAPDLSATTAALHALQRDAGQIAFALARIISEEGKDLRRRLAYAR